MRIKFEPDRKGIFELRKLKGVEDVVSKYGEDVAREAVRQAKQVGRARWEFAEYWRRDYSKAVMRFEEDYTIGKRRPRSAIIAHHPSGKGRVEGRRAIKRALKSIKER